MKRLFLRQGRGYFHKPASACRWLLKNAVPAKTSDYRHADSTRFPGGAGACDREAGSIMLDLLIGLLIATVGICLVLGGIALTTWRAGYAKEDTLKIIQTRNERDKAPIFEIDPDTYKTDEINPDIFKTDE